MTLKAVAYKSGMADSAVVEATYPAGKWEFDGPTSNEELTYCVPAILE